MAAVLLYVCSTFVVWLCCAVLAVQADNVRCPSSCTCLGNNVDCSNFGLLNIPDDIPGWVTRLELQFNGITEIRPNDLKGLYNLQYLDLGNNDIKFINGSVFRDLTALQTLKLDANELTKLPLFPVPLNITELTMTQNHVVTIPLLAMSRMPELLSLDLSNNYILSITNGSFPVGCKLAHLNLNNNQIAALDRGSLNNLTFLETLKINKNKVMELPQGVFNKLISLKTLEIMRNKIRMIKGLTFQGLDELQILKLKRNSISVLKDGAFWGLPSIVNLQMDHNDITNVTKGWVFGLKTMKYLSLAHNKISKMEMEAWEPCKHLEKLDLSHNRMTAILESTLAHLAALDTLLLDHNQISRIDEGAFRDLTKLNVLEMNNNEISWTMEDISGAFRGLTSLTKLGLEANAIRSIAVHAFSGLPRLRQLHLEDNDITSVQENAFETLRELRVLRFNSSKLFCDCHLSWLPPWLKQSGFQHSAVGTCFHPPLLRGAAILQVDLNQLTCNNAEFPKPVILESPKSSNGFKGENMTLICIAAITGNSQPKIYWKKDNVVLDDSRSSVTASSDGEIRRYTSNLNLHDIQDSMAGRYQCVVTNEFGSAFSQRAYVNVYVYPMFLKTPKDVTVKAGKPAELKCAATGQPSPVISWQKDGGDNFPAARERRMRVYPNDDRFYIMNTRVADEGVYSCKARNEAGVIVTNATVTVLETPDFVQPMQMKKATKRGETTVLQCMASGSPQPKLTWLKDDKELVMTPRHFFTVDNQILVVVDTQWSDAGVYACRMSNSLGTAKGTTELQVLSSSGEVADAGGSFGLDDESTTTGIIIIAVVCCVVGTSLVWVIIIYQTRKRHEVYSATPTDETTLPGEVPSSGYMSSDKEGNYSQGPINLTGYHYQDYQMKESGYESSSGQFRANGYLPPTIYPSDVVDDDNCPPTLTAGDRLLRQMKKGTSASSLQYPASDGDTIGSRHSTSSGHHSGSSDPPSSHSGQSVGHHQIQMVINSQHRDAHPSPSAPSPEQDEPSEYSMLRSSQQHLFPDGRPLLQTFHPKKHCDGANKGSTSSGGNKMRGEDGRLCENSNTSDRNRHHSDSCDNRDFESPNSTQSLRCMACLQTHSAGLNSNSIHGRSSAQVEIHHSDNYPQCQVHRADYNSGVSTDGTGRSNKYVNNNNNINNNNNNKPPMYLPTPSVISSPSPPLQLPPSGSRPYTDSKSRVPPHSRGCLNKNNLCSSPHHSYVGDGCDHDSSHCNECHHALSSNHGTTTGSTQRVGTPSPCYYNVMRDPLYYSTRPFPHQHENGADGAGVSVCSKCRCQHHHHHHLPSQQQQQPQYHKPNHQLQRGISRSRSSNSVGGDPSFYTHCDTWPSPSQTECGICSCVSGEGSGRSDLQSCQQPSLHDYQSHQPAEMVSPSAIGTHCQDRPVGHSLSVHNVLSSSIPAKPASSKLSSHSSSSSALPHPSSSPAPYPLPSISTMPNTGEPRTINL